MAPGVFTSESTSYLLPLSPPLSLSLSPPFRRGAAPVTDPILSRMQLITRRATAKPQSHQVSLKEINKRTVRRARRASARYRLAYLSAINRGRESPLYPRIIQIGPRVLYAGRSTTEGGERETGRSRGRSCFDPPALKKYLVHSFPVRTSK